MKYLFILVFACFSLYSSAQKGTTKITVPIKDTAGILDSVSLIFYRNGYAIKQKDEKLRFVNTEKKPLQKTAADISINALVTDTAVIYSATYEMELHGSRYSYNLKQGGTKGSPQRLAWQEVERIAKQLLY